MKNNMKQQTQVLFDQQKHQRTSVFDQVWPKYEGLERPNKDSCKYICYYKTPFIYKTLQNFSPTIFNFFFQVSFFLQNYLWPTEKASLPKFSKYRTTLHLTGLLPFLRNMRKRWPGWYKCNFVSLNLVSIFTHLSSLS